MDRDPNIVNSSHSGQLTENGITIRLEIYRLEHDPSWALEVVNENGTSIVWDELFASDDDAFSAFRATVEEEGMKTFLDNAKVIPFPRQR